jgi:excisionase family DNA binding protein
MAIASASILPTWRSLDDAADQTGIGRRTLSRWVSDGKLRAYSRAGDRKRYVDLDDIRKLQELRPVAKYIGDVSVIPPNSRQSQPTIYVLEQLGVASHSLRTKPDPNNPYSFRFPLQVWASSRAEAIERLRQTALEALAVALEGRQLRPDRVLVEIDPDSVRGPSLG